MLAMIARRLKYFPIEISSFVIRACHSLVPNAKAVG